MSSDTGKWIMIAGSALILIGAVIYFFHDKLDWIGRLPGDIRIEKENFRLYFPITTIILFSAVITVLTWVIKKIT